MRGISDTWRCHICGNVRPDALIAVRSADVSAEWGLPEGSMTQNVRYCADREPCREAAETFRHTAPPGAPPRVGPLARLFTRTEAER